MDDQLPTPQQLPVQDTPLSSGASRAAHPAPSVAAIPLQAADSDTLELEWSQRAHQALSSAAHDPSRLVESFASLKAQYIYARYGKQIPIKSEEA